MINTKVKSNKEEKWVVIYYHYGRHCDDFEVDKVVGPYSFDEADDIEGAYNGEGCVTCAIFERKS